VSRLLLDTTFVVDAQRGDDPGALAALRVGAHDLIIAATARAGGRTVVTADAAAFAGLPGVAVLPHR